MVCHFAESIDPYVFHIIRKVSDMGIQTFFIGNGVPIQATVFAGQKA